jgi:hypothetical protein
VVGHDRPAAPAGRQHHDAGGHVVRWWTGSGKQISDRTREAFAPHSVNGTIGLRVPNSMIKAKMRPYLNAANSRTDPN